MNTAIKKWGNSQGIRIPAELLRLSGFMVGDQVNLSVKDNTIIISLISGKEKKLYADGALKAYANTELHSKEKNAFETAMREKYGKTN